MSAPHATQIIEGYMARLDAELKDLSPDRRRELVEDVRNHISDARADVPEESDAELLTIIDRLGEPAEVAREARDRETERPSVATLRWAWVELAAILLTIVVWPAGVVLVWLSRVWSTREKLIGTLIGGVAFLVGFPLFGPLMGPILTKLVQLFGQPFPLLVSALGAFNIVAAIYLAVRLNRKDSVFLGVSG